MKGVILIQQKRSELREKIIKDLLVSYKRSNTKFSSMTHLSEHLAQHISRELKSKISGSTLRRNSQYKNLLLKYIEENKGLTTEKKISVDISIELRRLKKINRGLEDEITLLHSKIAENNALNLENKGHPKAKKLLEVDFIESKEKDSLKRELLGAYSLISDLLKLSGGYSSDINKGIITNYLDDVIIMTKDEFPTFFAVQTKDFKY